MPSVDTGNMIHVDCRNLEIVVFSLYSFNISADLISEKRHGHNSGKYFTSFLSVAFRVGSRDAYTS